MSNKQFEMEDFAHVTPQHVGWVDKVLQDRKARRYSVSAIFKAHNAIFKLNEKPQTCDTCLVTRANALQKWRDWYAKQEKTEAPQEPQTPVPNIGQLPTPSVVPLNQTEQAALDDKTVAVTTGAPDSTPAALPPEDRNELTAARLDALQDAQSTDPNAPSYVAPAVEPAQVDDEPKKDPDGLRDPAEGAVRGIFQKIDKDTFAPDGDAMYGDFTPNADDATKGVIINPVTGRTFTAGTYATEDTKKILSVQVGGKAAYKALE